MATIEDFQVLQRNLVRNGFDSTFRAWREGNEAVSSLTVALHAKQEPEVMAKLSELITQGGFAFTAEGETVHVTDQAR
jgi:hypothetical protein